MSQALVSGVLGDGWSIAGNQYEVELDYADNGLIRFRRLKLDMSSSRWQYGRLQSRSDSVIEFERITKLDYEAAKSSFAYDRLTRRRGGTMKSFKSRQVDFIGVVGDDGEVLDIRSKVYIFEDGEKHQLQIGNVIFGGQCRAELDQLNKGEKVAFRARVNTAGGLARICQVGRPIQPDCYR